MGKTKLAVRGLCGAGLCAIAACTPLPEGTEKGDLEFFEQAVASIDCELVKSADYYTVEFQAGLTRAQVLEFAGYELSTERAVRLEDGGIRLIAGPCAEGAEPQISRIELAAGS